MRLQLELGLIVVSKGVEERNITFDNIREQLRARIHSSTQLKANINIKFQSIKILNFLPKY